MFFTVIRRGRRQFVVRHVITGADEGRRTSFGAARRLVKYLNRRAWLSLRRRGGEPRTSFESA